MGGHRTHYPLGFPTETDQSSSNPLPFLSWWTGREGRLPVGRKVWSTFAMTSAPRYILVLRLLGYTCDGQISYGLGGDFVMWLVTFPLLDPRAFLEQGPTIFSPITERFWNRLPDQFSNFHGLQGLHLPPKNGDTSFAVTQASREIH